MAVIIYCSEYNIIIIIIYLILLVWPGGLLSYLTTKQNATRRKPCTVVASTHY